MNKRGISAIVATVLIILITVAGVTILWAAVIPMIQQGFAFSELEGRVSVVSSEGYTFYDADRELAMVQVKRDVDDGVMDRIKIIFSFDGSSFSSLVLAPESGLTKVYTFNLSRYSEPDSVSVAPIFVVGETEKEGSVTSEVMVSTGVISEVDSVVYELGGDYIYTYTYDAVFREGLVLYLPFDGNANDYSGEGNDGIVDDAVFTGGMYSQAMSFDGNEDYVMMEDDNPEFNFTQTGFTVCTWFYNLDDNLENEGIVSGRFGWEDGHPGWSWVLYQGWSNDITFSVYNSTGGGVGANPPGSLGNDKWHHACGVFNLTNAILYLDNVTTVSSSFVGTLKYFSTDNIQLGQYYSGSYFNGLIDEVTIYNRSLSADEISQLYMFPT